MTAKNALAAQAHKTRTESCGWMIQQVAGRMNGLMKQELAALSLKQDQFMLLMTLGENQDLTQTELGGRVHLPNYAVTRALDALEAAGLVERRDDAASRRAYRVFLTNQGKALMPQLFDVVARVNAQTLAALDATQQAQFRTLLSQLVKTAR